MDYSGHTGPNKGYEEGSEGWTLNQTRVMTPRGDQYNLSAQLDREEEYIDQLNKLVEMAHLRLSPVLKPEVTPGMVSSDEAEAMMAPLTARIYSQNNRLRHVIDGLESLLGLADL